VQEPPDKRVGTEFAGRYQILRLLGEGGMGAVYEARHLFTGRHVALKLIHAVVARSPTARERFLREAQAPSSIGHAAIVEVLDAGVEEETPYLALELLSGEDLASAIGAQRVEAGDLVRITSEVLGALDAAHEAGLVHRDIKPENVFLVEEGGGPRVKLLDFGITRQLHGTDSKLTGTGTILGTPYYMSPEQARGEPVDGRADVWSVGAMLYHGLAGRPPFQADNYNLLIVSILTTEAAPLATLRPELPAPLCEVVDRALRRDREARWASAAEMRAALDACEEIRGALGASFGTAETLPSDHGATGNDGEVMAPAASAVLPATRGFGAPATPPLGGMQDATTPPAPAAPELTGEAVGVPVGGRGRALLLVAAGAAVTLLLAGVGAGLWIATRPPGDTVGEGLSAPPAPAPPAALMALPDAGDAAAGEVAEGEAAPDAGPVIGETAAGGTEGGSPDRTVSSGTMRGGASIPAIEGEVTVDDEGRVSVGGVPAEEILRAVGMDAERRAQRAEKRAQAALRQARMLQRETAEREARRLRLCHHQCAMDRMRCFTESREEPRGTLRCHEANARCVRACQ